ncbi:hypothetical protein BTJ_1126 [Burkholderia thailandensis E444]|nr:hypothetical protein BTJ_1126 [Burkholderia thailandensis E444]AVR10423.1 paar motif family protein [Burkholderia thailandensis]KIS58193.1 hypothetical protein BTP_2533 [Burkholderia thailandensis Phuket 4W-1]AWY68926.1 paar motif family protein [Burkholderia thailandensis]MCS6473373.1 paar motif family protein [Burkholderia thailandensis]
MRFEFVGVAYSTGATTQGENYREARVPDDAKPVYLTRDECIAYGQSIDGADVLTPPKALDVGMVDYFAVIPSGTAPGAVYGVSYCVLHRPTGRVRIALPSQDGGRCASSR